MVSLALRPQVLAKERAVAAGRVLGSGRSIGGPEAKCSLSAVPTTALVGVGNAGARQQLACRYETAAAGLCCAAGL